MLPECETHLAECILESSMHAADTAAFYSMLHGWHHSHSQESGHVTAADSSMLIPAVDTVSLN